MHSHCTQVEALMENRVLIACRLTGAGFARVRDESAVMRFLARCWQDLGKWLDEDVTKSQG